MSTLSISCHARASAASGRRRALASIGCAALGLAALAVAAPSAGNGTALEPAIATALRQSAEQRARAAWTGSPPQRVTVTLGRIDPQLQLAPCGAVEPYHPAGMAPWGPTRVGLRCADGMTSWKVTLPATVQITVQALVALVALPAGQTIAPNQVATAEVDASASADLLPPEPTQAVGRLLGRALAVGEPLRRGHLRQRQWFAAGDTVVVVAAGPGWTVTTQGRAVSAGVEGQTASVRTDGGRVVTGYPKADHRLEVAL